MTEDELPARVEKWLSDQGYPLEMEVGRAFRDAGWSVDHARWYRDPSTGAMRELDLIASRFADSEDGATLGLDLVIECKRSRDKPWVSLASKSSPVVLLDRVFPGGISYDADFVRSAKRIRPPMSLLPGAGNRVGHGIVAAFKDRKDGDPTAPFSAVRAVSSAVFALDHEQSEVALMWGDAKPWVIISAPLLVLDGSLFEYHMDGAATAQTLTRVDRSVLEHPHDEFHRIRINILTRDAVETFAEALGSEVDELLSALLPHLSDVLIVHRQRRERLDSRFGSTGS